MDPPPVSPPPVPPPSGLCWSAVLQNKPPPKPEESISSRVFGNVRSSKGISVAVVDANAIIHGDNLTNSADKFVTVSEVLDEVRDPVSRQRLAFLPIHVETMVPTSDALKKVVKFARETGDLQTLSDVDLKLIALAYTLEAQIHGTDHLRERPPPLRMVSVRNLQEAEMPGWGKNVPNLEEWEALEHAAEGDVTYNDSRILPLKDLNFNSVPVSETAINVDEQEDGDQFSRRHIRYNRPKKEIKIEGKKMVADGIDASQGEYEDNPEDWRPAVSRGTHRRYLRRKARRDMEASSNASIVESCDVLSDGGSESTEMITRQSPGEAEFVNGISKEDGLGGISGECNISAEQGDTDMKCNPSKPLQEDEELATACSALKLDSVMMDAASKHLDTTTEGDEIEIYTRELDHLEISSQTDDASAVSRTDDASSEQSWALRSLSESSVACVTSDFAMQNVILQIGLRLLVPGGMQIRQLHRWVLKCHACNKVTAEIGRIFCPKCGNGGTLRKVSVTVSENGIILAARRPRISLRGTKFSLPLPQGGRDGITKNLILREDQIPQRLLYPKLRKKNNKNEKEFFSADDIFSHSGVKKAPLKPPVGKAVAVFCGRRNPNDNHFSRRKL